MKDRTIRKSKEETKKALSICHAGNGCKYGTNPECPYRISDSSCDLAGLIADADRMITELEGDKESLWNCIDKAAKALGYDCDNCDRW